MLDVRPNRAALALGGMVALALLVMPGPAAETKETPPLIVFMPPSAEELAEVALPDLRAELLHLAADDQQARLVGGCGAPDTDAEAAAANVAAVDRANTERFKAIVEQHGWPTVALVGSDGAHAAWLLAQHADHDPDFQQRCLAFMETHVDNGQADPIDVAYLTDRVRVNADRPQLYGTQFQWADGKRHPKPIEDPDGVDERRKSLGMRNMRAYSKYVNT